MAVTQISEMLSRVRQVMKMDMSITEGKNYVTFSFL